MSALRRDVVLDRVEQGPVNARIYQGAECGSAPAVILYLHGGAFLDTTSGTDRPIAEALADSGAIVVAADYGARSGNIFPQVLECAFSVLSYFGKKQTKLGSKRSPLFVAGEESGGNIAAGVALKARDQMPGTLDGQILLSPLLDPFMGSSSFREAGDEATRQRWASGWNHYLACMKGVCHPYAAPSYCSRLSGLAPALVVTAEDDPLRDEAIGYAARLKAAGVKVNEHILPTDSGWTSSYGEHETKTQNWRDSLRMHFERFLHDVRDAR